MEEGNITTTPLERISILRGYQWQIVDSEMSLPRFADSVPSLYQAAQNFMLHPNSLLQDSKIYPKDKLYKIIMNFIDLEVNNELKCSLIKFIINLHIKFILYFYIFIL